MPRLRSKPLNNRELSDQLWRLDEAIRVRGCQVSERTGRAWKAAVEGGNWQRELLEARTLAREFIERIQSVIDNVIKDEPFE